jgi:hypothetical protein
MLPARAPCLPALLLWLFASPAGGQSAGASPGKPLEACTAAFLGRLDAVAGDTNLLPKVFVFLPARGPVTHHRDVRLPRGAGIREEIWRFPAEQVRVGPGRRYWVDRLLHRWNSRGRPFGNFADR